MLGSAWQEFSLVRASFMLTHRVDCDSFDFMAVLDEALDADFAKVRSASYVLLQAVAVVTRSPSRSCKIQAYPQVTLRPEVHQR